jgi:hypothetical protein
MHLTANGQKYIIISGTCNLYYFIALMLALFSSKNVQIVTGMKYVKLPVS